MGPGARRRRPVGVGVGGVLPTLPGALRRPLAPRLILAAPCLPLRVQDAHADAHGLKAHRGTGQPGKGIALLPHGSPGCRTTGRSTTRRPRPGDDQALDQAPQHLPDTCPTTCQHLPSICRTVAGFLPVDDCPNLIQPPAPLTPCPYWTYPLPPISWKIGLAFQVPCPTMNPCESLRLAWARRPVR